MLCSGVSSTMVGNLHEVQGVLASLLLFVTATQGMAPLLWSGEDRTLPDASFNVISVQLQCWSCDPGLV